MHFISLFTYRICFFTKHSFILVLWRNKTSQLIQSSLCINIIQQTDTGNVYIVWSDKECGVCNFLNIALVCICNTRQEVNKTSCNFFTCRFKIENNCLFSIQTVSNITCFFKSFWFNKNYLKLWQR